MPENSVTPAGVVLTLMEVPDPPRPVTMVPDTPEAMAAYLNVSALTDNSAGQPRVVLTAEQAKQKLAGTVSTGNIAAVGGNVGEPILRQNANPEYSDAARQARVQGTVELMIVAGDDGLVKGVEVTRSLGFGLDEKAAEAVRKWKFSPATRNGIAVPVYVSVLVNFSLRAGPGNRRTVTTDAQGNATFSDLKPGRYLLAGQIGGYAATASVFVTPDYSEIAFGLAPTASVTGHIYDSIGMPVPNARVTLGVVTRLEGRLQFIQGPTVISDVSGAYRIPAIAGGDYHLLTQPPGAATSVFYPGTESLDQAMSLSIRPGQETVGIDISVTR